MTTTEQNLSVTAVLEQFIARENETLALYERTLHSLGDTTVTPVIHRLIAEKEHQRRMLEQTLDEVNEQLVLDEAII